MATYSTVGLEFAGCVLVGLVVGYWIDGKLGTGWVTFVGLAVGITAGYRTLWRALQIANRQAQREEEEERETRKRFHDDE